MSAGKKPKIRKITCPLCKRSCGYQEEDPICYQSELLKYENLFEMALEEIKNLKNRLSCKDRENSDLADKNSRLEWMLLKEQARVRNIITLRDTPKKLCDWEHKERFMELLQGGCLIYLRDTNKHPFERGNMQFMKTQYPLDSRPSTQFPRRTVPPHP
jgi:hypothetical protein